MRSFSKRITKFLPGRRAEQQRLLEEQSRQRNWLVLLLLLLLSFLISLLIYSLRHPGYLKRILQNELTFTKPNTYHNGRAVSAYISRDVVNNAWQTIQDEQASTYDLSKHGYDGGKILVGGIQLGNNNEGNSTFNNVTYYDKKSGNSMAFDLECEEGDSFCRIYRSSTWYWGNQNSRRLGSCPLNKLSASVCGGIPDNTRKYRDRCFDEDHICPTSKPFLDIGSIRSCQYECGCFSHDALVTVQSKDPKSQSSKTTTKKMHELEIGDSVLTGNGSFQKVYGFAHRHENAIIEFLQVYTKGKQDPLELTANHLVYKVGSDKPVPAWNLRVGDHLYDQRGVQAFERTEALIMKITTITREDGLYAPLTADGTIIVNGMVSSVYVAVQERKQESGDGTYLTIAGNKILSNHALMHLWFAPMRVWCLSLTDNFCRQQDAETGFTPWLRVGKSLLDYGLRQHWLVQAFILVAALTSVGAIYLVETIAVLLGTCWIRYSYCAALAMLIGTVASRSFNGGAARNGRTL